MLGYGTALTVEAQTELEGAVREVGSAIVQAWDDASPQCLTASLNKAKKENLDAQLDDLLGQLRSGLTRDNFASQAPEISEPEWAAWDAAEARRIAGEYEDLLASLNDACSNVKQALDAAQKRLEKHRDAIAALGADAYKDLVERVLLEDPATGGPCEWKCNLRFVADSVIAIGTGLAVAVGCTALSGGLAVLICFAAAVLIGSGLMTHALMNKQECKEACEEKEDHGDDHSAPWRYGELQQ